MTHLRFVPCMEMATTGILPCGCDEPMLLWLAQLYVSALKACIMQKRFLFSTLLLYLYLRGMILFFANMLSLRIRFIFLNGLGNYTRFWNTRIA